MSGISGGYYEFTETFDLPFDSGSLQSLLCFLFLDLVGTHTNNRGENGHYVVPLPATLEVEHVKL